MAVTKLLLDDPPSADSSSVDGESKSSDTESETVNHRREDKNDDKDGKKNSSKSESESESDSESEKSYTTPPSAGFAVKPVDPKPSSKRKTSDGGEESSASSSSSEDEESKSKKKKKKTKKEEKQRKLSPPPANGGTARLWSEDDEIAILEALSDYRLEKGSEPRSDAAEFHGFVSPRLSVEVSKCQLYEKVRRLKKKYLVAAAAAAEGGPSSSSSPKPHDLRRFELSKKFWGANPQNHAATTPTKKKKKKEVDSGEFRAEFPRLSESWRLASGPIGSESLARKLEDSMPLIRSSKAKQLEKKWKQLEAEEVELRLQRSELARQTYQLILDAIKPED